MGDTVKQKRDLEKECAEILEFMVKRYKFLHPNSPTCDQWSRTDAANAIADLVAKLKYSDVIEENCNKGWGK